MAWAWGSGKYGRLGLGNTLDASVPAPVTKLAGKNVKQIAAGAYVTAFIVDDGQLYMSGKDTEFLFAGTVDDQEKFKEDYLSPIPLQFFLRIHVEHIAVGEKMCALIAEFGVLYWWGSAYGEAVQSMQSGHPVKMKSVRCGGAHALALSADGCCYSWGENDTRQLGQGGVGEFLNVPTKLKFPGNVTIKQVACGYTSSVVLTAKGTVYGSGSIVGQQSMELIAPLNQLNSSNGVNRIKKLNCNDSYVCVVTLMGEAFLYQRVSLPFSPMTEGNNKVSKIFSDLSVRTLICGADFVSCVTDAGAVHSWGRCSLQLGLGEVQSKKKVVGPRLLGSFSARFVRSLSYGTAHVTACLAPPQNAEREAAGWELLETERIYFRSLLMLVEVFKGLAKPRSPLGKLFAELEQMIKPHKEILQDLESRMENWSDQSCLGSLLMHVAKKSNIDNYTRFHRLHSEWSKTAHNYVPGGKHAKETELLNEKTLSFRKTDSPYERKKPLHLVGLLSEPFERIRQYFWLCDRLVALTPDWHHDYKDLNSASECFQRELSGYYSEHEMMRMTINRLEGDKEELLKKLGTLSATNDNLYLSRNNHEMKKRELTDVMEQHEHKINTMKRETTKLKEKILQLRLEKQLQTIIARKKTTLQSLAEEEAAVHKSNVKRLEVELTVAKSTKLIRDVQELRVENAEKDKEILMLKEKLLKAKEMGQKSKYTDAHVQNLERESIRLAKHLEAVQAKLVESIQKRYDPIWEESDRTHPEQQQRKDSQKKSDRVTCAPDGSVRGGTVQGLIDLLIKQDENTEDSYRKCFFLTYRLFISPIELNYALQEAYCRTADFDMDPQTLWSRVLSLYRFWITQHNYDFLSVEGMKTLLWGFLEETVCVTVSRVVGDSIMREFHKQTYVDEKNVLQRSEVRAKLSGTASPRTAVDLSVMSSPDQAKAIVELLIQIDFTLLCGIQSKELLGCQWLKENKEQASPGVVAVTMRFNKVCNWVIAEILSRRDVKDRRDVMAAFINMAQKARVLGACNTVMQLVAALNNAVILRLKQTWELLSRKDRTLFEELELFCSPKGSFKYVREMIKDRREKKQSCLPYLGMFLSDLVFTVEGSMTELSPGVVNFGRLVGISETIEEVLQLQQIPFVFANNHNAATHNKLQDYLISCQVFEEEETWKMSYALEAKSN
jgi:alpha-tubulin suppressor-like RCC1 family protein